MLYANDLGVRCGPLNSADQVLLGEFHHRWSNNLQIITSTLMLAARQAPQETRLSDLVDRVGTVAALMAEISRALAFPPPPLGYESFWCRLASCVVQMHGRDLVTARVDATPTDLHPNDAQILSMLIVEFVTNACKHGFERYDAGTIHVQVATEDGCTVLRVHDDGRGLAVGQQGGETVPRIGRALAQLLNAKMTFTATPHVHVEIRLPRVLEA
jgi:two-component sensor histidine kinase